MSGKRKMDEGGEAISRNGPEDQRAFRVHSGEIRIQTEGEGDIVNITEELHRLVRDSGIHEGIATVFVPGATGALTTMEFEPGALEDLREALQRIAPKGIEYRHHLKWGDGNGHSHVRAALIGPSVSLPVREGSLPLGTWQSVVFIELDTRPRKRSMLVQIVGNG
ncbi:MAG: secondary thiamine-phosphate synthase enzyme YjbQ [Thermoplasmata archaeon]